MRIKDRKKLADVLGGSGGGAGFGDLWNNTAAADDNSGPIPPGEYRCRVVAGELAESRSGTPSYKLTFQVAEGEHAGRRVWHDLWLTPAAMPTTKRDLAKLGIVEPAQLDRPLPSGFVAKVKVILHRGDNGNEFNRVKHFEVVAVEKPEPDPFAPKDDGEDQDDDRDDADDGDGEMEAFEL